mgnify:CR=1 FL=1
MAERREEGAMSKLVKLEKMLERGLGRLRHPETGRELIEAHPDEAYLYFNVA